MKRSAVAGRLIGAFILISLILYLGSDYWVLNSPNFSAPSPGWELICQYIRYVLILVVQIFSLI